MNSGQHENKQSQGNDDALPVFISEGAGLPLEEFDDNIRYQDNYEIKTNTEIKEDYLYDNGDYHTEFDMGRYEDI